ncbi:MAG: thioredoxin [Candidatus Hodarchaeota archaeon]
MSDDELERIRAKKAEMLFKLQSEPREIINVKTENEFNNLLKDFPDKVLIVDFWAEWCSPCKLFTPIFERVNQEYSHEFIFAKVNVDENPMIAQFFGISSIPTTLFMKGGKVLRKFVGVLNYESLKQVLSKYKI